MHYKKIKTSAEVWAVIKAAHPDLVVFSTVSNPEGDPHGSLNDCRMMTEYGFKESDFPLLGANTTWSKDLMEGYERTDMETEYWLCAVISND